MDLSENSCVPCQGNIPILSPEIVHKLLAQIDTHWQINNAGHLYREYQFKNFKEAMNFANAIALLSEQQGHHPDLNISWGKCALEIWTHKINGLSESDFYLAAKIDKLK